MGSVTENFSEHVSDATYYADLAAHTEGEAGKRYALIAQTYATLALAVATRGDGS